MEQKRYELLRIWKTTHRLLRQIAAQTDESLVEVVHRLAQAEWERLFQKKDQERHS